MSQGLGCARFDAGEVCLIPEAEPGWVVIMRTVSEQHTGPGARCPTRPSHRQLGSVRMPPEPRDWSATGVYPRLSTRHPHSAGTRAGGDHTGRALEVVAIRLPDGPLVIHVQDLQEKFRRYYDQAREEE